MKISNLKQHLSVLYHFSQEEVTDKNMAPDGYYVPRILFVGKYLQHLSLGVCWVLVCMCSQFLISSHSPKTSMFRWTGGSQLHQGVSVNSVGGCGVCVFRVYSLT